MTLNVCIIILTQNKNECKVNIKKINNDYYSKTRKYVDIVRPKSPPLRCRTRQECRRTFFTPAIFRDAHCSRCRTVIIRCTATKSQRRDITKWDYLLRAVPRSVNPERDCSLGKLSKSIQPDCTFQSKIDEKGLS